MPGETAHTAASGQEAPRRNHSVCTAVLMAGFSCRSRDAEQPFHRVLAAGL